MIAVLDYGMGNLRSVQRGIEHVGGRAEITSDPNRAAAAAGLALPGQGEFGSAMRGLRESGLEDERRWISSALGSRISASASGLQALFESSEEAPGVPGLGLLPGVVKRLPPGLKTPHMGWNQLEMRREAPYFRDVKEGDHVYFVHSYCAEPARESRTSPRRRSTASVSRRRSGARTSSQRSSIRKRVSGSG